MLELKEIDQVSSIGLTSTIERRLSYREEREYEDIFLKAMESIYRKKPTDLKSVILDIQNSDYGSDYPDSLFQDCLFEFEQQKMKKMIDNLRGYFYRICKNKLIDDFHTIEKMIPNCIIKTLTPEEFQYKNTDKHLNNKIARWVENLPKRPKMAFKLIYLEDLSIEETAHLMSVETKTVKQYLNKASVLLKKDLPERFLLEHEPFFRDKGDHRKKITRAETMNIARWAITRSTNKKRKKISEISRMTKEELVNYCNNLESDNPESYKTKVREAIEIWQEYRPHIIEVSSS